MRSSIYILLFTMLLLSCSKKERKVYKINLTHYSSAIIFDKLNDYDTLVVWNWYNDNSASHRRCYRIQNSKLGITMEQGMLPKKAKNFDQMTIKAPISPNEFPKRAIRDWLSDHQERFLSDRPSDKIFKKDSITIDNRNFGIFGLQTASNYSETKVIYMTNINNEFVEFEFCTNKQSFDSFYKKTLVMMKTIKVIQN